MAGYTCAICLSGVLQMGKIIVVVGGCFGSEGKGAVAGFLSANEPNLYAVRVGGPNAGHTVVDAQGTAWKLRHIPVAAVTNPGAKLVIAAGSEVDPEVLAKEIFELELAGYEIEGRLYIDPTATTIEAAHQARESDMASNGHSTGKGIGAARADRVMRTARTWDHGGEVVSGALRAHLRVGGTVLIEGTQGYGLGLHTQFYPKSTSGDCRAIDFLAQAGLSPWDLCITRVEVWVVARTKPIRIAGDSGPLEGETTWDKLGLPEEYTTVTNKVRRVGSWNPVLVRQAVSANGGPGPCVRVALTFADYEFGELAGSSDPAAITPEAGQWLQSREQEISSSIRLVGTGPRSWILKPPGGWVGSKS